MKDAAELAGEVFQNRQRVVPGIALVNDDIQAEFGGEIELGRESLGLGGFVGTIDDRRLGILRHLGLKRADGGGGGEFFGRKAVIVEAGLANCGDLGMRSEGANLGQPVAFFVVHIRGVKSHDGVDVFKLLGERYGAATAFHAGSDRDDPRDSNRASRIEDGGEIVGKIGIIEVRVSVDEHGGSLAESGARGERGLH